MKLIKNLIGERILTTSNVRLSRNFVRSNRPIGRLLIFYDILAQCPIGVRLKIPEIHFGKTRRDKLTNGIAIGKPISCSIFITTIARAEQTRRELCEILSPITRTFRGISDLVAIGYCDVSYKRDKLERFISSI